MIPTYKPSGLVGFLTLPLLVLGLMAAVALAFVYQLALYWIPLIYLNFLATVGVGFALGAIGSWVINKGKVRNKLIGMLFGLLLALAALSSKYYFQYRSMLDELTTAVMAENQVPADQRNVVREAVAGTFTFWKHFEFRIQRGWNIGRAGGNGAPVGGFLVYLVWAIEAGIIIYWSAMSPREAAGEPFSETHKTWASEHETVMTLPITDPQMLEKIQSATNVDDLLQIPIPKSDESNQFAVYSVNSIPGQEVEDAYLTVKLLSISLDKDGNPVRKEKPLVKHAVLSIDKRKQLNENASLLKEAIAMYRKSLEEEAVKQASDAQSSNDNPAT